MSETFADLSQLSREELYSMINELKRENNCLKTDLLRFKVLSKSCGKYLTDLLNIKQISCDLIQKIGGFVSTNGTQSHITCGSTDGQTVIGGSVDTSRESNGNQMNGFSMNKTIILFPIHLIFISFISSFADKC